MKKLLLGLCLVSAGASAQIDLGTPVATGKGGVSTAITHDWQCLGINPANLGFDDNYKFSFGLANYGFSAQSKAIDLSLLSGALINPNKKFTLPQKQELAVKFATPDGLNLYSNANWFAASIYFPKLGGIAINLRDRIAGHVTLSQNTADIIFNGSNAAVYQDPNIGSKRLSDILEGTKISYYHYRELNLAYGRKVIGKEDAVELFAGGGYKYLWGIGNMGFKAENGQISGYSSFSTDYGFDISNIKNYKPETTNAFFKTVGTGHGFDLGTAIKVKGIFTVAASVTDMGKINWAKNTLIVVDTTMPQLDTSDTGLQSWDANSIAGFLYNSLSGMIKYNDGDPYSTQLPTRLRLGTGLKLGKRVLVGADVVMPLSVNDKTYQYDLQGAFFALGGEVKLWGSSKLSTGISGNKNYGFSVPLGFTLGSLGITEFYIATNDIITFVSKSKNPQLSFAIAVFRFNLKNPLKNEVK